MRLNRMRKSMQKFTVIIKKFLSIIIDEKNSPIRIAIQFPLYYSIPNSIFNSYINSIFLFKDLKFYSMFDRSIRPRGIRKS